MKNYTKELKSSYKEELKRKISTLELAEHILSYKKPELIDTPPHIKQWYQTLDSLKSGEMFLHLAPRGHSKTTTHTINFPIREIALNRNIRITICSNTVGQADSFAYEIMQQLESNELIKYIYGNFRDENTWTSGRFIVKRNTISKDATVATAGVGGAILSRRTDLLIFDDILDEENTSTETQREKVKTWFWKVAMPTLVPTGRVIVVGTRWHYSDLYGELIKLKGFKSRVDQAIDKDNKVLWPTMYSRKKLEKIKAMQGTIIFNCQYLNDPSGMQGNIFKGEWLKYYTGELIKDNTQVFIDYENIT